MSEPFSESEDTAPTGISNPFMRHAACDHPNVETPMILKGPDIQVDLFGWLQLLDQDLAEGNIRDARAQVWGMAHILEQTAAGRGREIRADLASRLARIDAQMDDELRRMAEGGE